MGRLFFMAFLWGATFAVLACPPVHFKLKPDRGDPVLGEAQVIILCQGNFDYSIPAVSTLHFISQDERTGEVCYWDRTCGNVSGFRGHFQMETRASPSGFFPMASFLRLPAFLSFARNAMGEEIYVILKMDYAQVERSCGPSSVPICFD